MKMKLKNAYQIESIWAAAAAAGAQKPSRRTEGQKKE